MNSSTCATFPFERVEGCSHVEHVELAGRSSDISELVTMLP